MHSALSSGGSQPSFRHDAERASSPPSDKISSQPCSDQQYVSHLHKAALTSETYACVSGKHVLKDDYAHPDGVPHACSFYNDIIKLDFDDAFFIEPYNDKPSTWGNCNPVSRLALELLGLAAHAITAPTRSTNTAKAVLV
jgi:hypothetical protein